MECLLLECLFLLSLDRDLEREWCRLLLLRLGERERDRERERERERLLEYLREYGLQKLVKETKKIQTLNDGCFFFHHEKAIFWLSM